jgi:NAD-dependent deacetylase
MSDQNFAQALRESKFCVAVTGSGISTASGLKTRQELWQSRVWDRDEYVFIAGHAENPSALWNLVRSFLEGADARTLLPLPNAAHIALAELQSAGFVKGIVTQNVDGLHQDAGSVDIVLEMHGSLRRSAYCQKCGLKSGHDCAHHILHNTYQCTACKSNVRPDVVLFGESVAKSVYDEAKRLIDQADTLLVVGTACDVAPTADWCLILANVEDESLKLQLLRLL